MSDGWLTAKEASDLTGMSRRTLQRHVDAGRLTCETVEGVRKYAEEDLERLLAGPADPPPDPGAQVLAQSLELNRLLLQPARLYSDLIERHALQMAERVKHLEQRHDELVSAKEEFIDASAERDMAMKVLEGSQARKDKAFNFALEKGVPLVLAGGKGGAMAKLIASLTPDQVELLLNTDLTTDAQKELLKGMLKTTDEKEPTDG